jgi:hypothetical protein
MTKKQLLERCDPAIVALRLTTRIDAAPLFGQFAVAAVGMAVLALGMLMLDDRTLSGEPVWLKPFKFSVSFAILFATLSFAVLRFSDQWRRNWVLLAGAVASAAAFAFEMAYIAAQASRQEASHFNEATPFHEIMYELMGTGATLLMITIGIVGIIALVDPAARLGRGLRLGIGVGFLLTVVLTSWVAGELAGNGGRYIGVPSEAHARVPLLGWSMEIGDLRPAHFLALHAMQALLVVGYLVDRYGAATRLVWAAAALYAIFTTVVFLHALGGVPLVSA